MKKHALRSTPTMSCVALACWALIAAGCNQTGDMQLRPSVKVTPLQTLNGRQQLQKQTALAAKDKLLESLLGELMQSMGTQGPAKSIQICKTRAPEIAAEVSTETGVRIGRTSFRLRNDANASPAWATDFVRSKVEHPVEIELPDGELGVLLPIRLKATCTLCHGSKEQVMPDVKAAIVSNYPNDAATGFQEGDIRGYFWIEVPSEKKTNNGFD